jgi:ribonuclease J
LRHVYVDEISGEEVEQFVLHDRQKISEEGIIAIITEVDSENRSLSRNPEVVARGLSPKETQEIQHMVQEVLRREFSQRKIINDWIYMRQRIREIVEKKIMQEFKRQPLILPVVIEV